MYRNVHEVCDLIMSHENPVMFVDTCAILNISNSLYMHELTKEYVASVIELIKLHEDNNIWLVTSQNIREEWTDNVDMVITTLEKELSRVYQDFSSMLFIINTILNTSYSQPQDILSLNIPTRIRSLSKNFLNTCLLLERKDKHTLLAMQRVRKNEAPARKGKPEPKDCEIVECFLELCQQLRAMGFSQKLIFFTANKEDFGTNKKLKAPLDTQFATLNAELVGNINHILAIAKNQT